MHDERYVFGPFVLEVPAFRLTRDGQRLELQPKALELLVQLARARGAPVSREVLQAELWPDVVVSEQSLRQAIHRLREALGDHDGLVETVPRKGWRLCGEVPSVEGPVPAERDRLVGRAEERAALELTLAEARLVTVFGPAGVGKTRLVQHFARERGSLWPGGAWFCDLSDADGLDSLLQAVARDLCLEGEIGRALALRGRCLVILDNFEQLASFAGATVGRWMDRCPLVQLLVTSRTVLSLPGEVIFALEPMAPADAEALFCARAQAARRDLRWTPTDQAAVGALVEQLDRLPLAIELAAARISVLSPSGMLERMRDRFPLLASSGGRPDRQATLRGTFDWSWELLGLGEQQALAQLSVFEGGFSLQAAEAVLQLEGGWALDAVHSLVGNALVQRAGEGRFTLLSSVHAYAKERLAQQSGTLSAQLRHGSHFATQPPQSADLDNLAAACRRAVARGDAELAAETARRAWQLLSRTGPFLLGHALLEAALQVPGLAPARRFTLHQHASHANRLLGRLPEALSHARQLMELAQGEPSREVVAWGVLATTSYAAEQTREAMEQLDMAMALARESGDARMLADGLAWRGLAHKRLEQFALAEQDLEDARALLQGEDHRDLLGTVTGNLGTLYGAQGRTALARERFEEALAISRAVGEPRAEAIWLANLGRLEGELGHDALACTAYESALQLSRAVGDLQSEANTLLDLARAEHRLGRLEAARDHLAAARRLALRWGGRMLLDLRSCEAELGEPLDREEIEEMERLRRQLSN